MQLNPGGHSAGYQGTYTRKTPRALVGSGFTSQIITSPKLLQQVKVSNVTGDTAHPYFRAVADSSASYKTVLFWSVSLGPGQRAG